MNTSVPRIDHPKKETIRRAFSKDPSYYHEYAEVQRESAQRLMASLEPWKAIIPKGPLLEIGCGTGFLSKELLTMFEGRPMEITDISSNMVSFSKKRLQKHTESDKVQFDVRDGEYLEAEEETYGLIIHNFVAQWFKDPSISMERMIECLKPGGLLLAAFPGNQSFPAWRTAAEQAEVPYTGNELPDTEEVVVKLSAGPVQVDYYEDTIKQEFSEATDFFRHLKRIGASTVVDDQSLNPSEFRRLIEQWESNSGGSITAEYHVVFIAAKKD